MTKHALLLQFAAESIRHPQGIYRKLFERRMDLSKAVTKHYGVPDPCCTEPEDDEEMEAFRVRKWEETIEQVKHDCLDLLARLANEDL